MTSERTPLHAIASNLMTKESAEAAGTFAKEKFQELKTQVSDGDFSIRLLALMGAVSLIFLSVTELLGKVLTLNIFGALIELYTVILALIALALEGKGQIPFFPASLGESIMHYALILRYVWGRGALYFVAGTLQLSQMGLLDLIVGGFMTFVGVGTFYCKGGYGKYQKPSMVSVSPSSNATVYIVVGRKAQAKLTALKNQAIPADMLKARFHQADRTNKGQLDMESFKTLALTLGLNLNRREVETAFMMLDKDGSGKIGYAEFEVWWNTVEQPSPFPQIV